MFWQKYCEKTQASYRIFIWMLRVLAAYFIINHELTDDYVCTGEIVYCSIHLNISFKIFEENLLSSDLIVVKTNKKSPWILVIAHKLFLIPLQPKTFFWFFNIFGTIVILSFDSFTYLTMIFIPSWCKEFRNIWKVEWELELVCCKKWEKIVPVQWDLWRSQKME